MPELSVQRMQVKKLPEREVFFALLFVLYKKQEKCCSDAQKLATGNFLHVRAAFPAAMPPFCVACGGDFFRLAAVSLPGQHAPRAFRRRFAACPTF